MCDGYMVKNGTLMKNTQYHSNVTRITLIEVGKTWFKMIYMSVLVLKHFKISLLQLLKMASGGQSLNEVIVALGGFYNT